MYGPVSEGMRLFKNRASVAVVGYSERPQRVSLMVTRFLIEAGNRITGINPNLESAVKTDILIRKSLAELESPVDIIQIFRNSAALGAIGEEILSLPWLPKLVWCQQGVVDFLFQQRLQKAGVPVVMDACPYALRNHL